MACRGLGVTLSVNTDPVLQEPRTMTEQGPQAAQPAMATTEAQRLAGAVLACIATAGGEESEICRELVPLLAAKGGGDLWRLEVGRLVAALVAGGLVQRSGKSLSATAAGMAAAAEFLGAKKGLPASWPAARDGLLVAKALEVPAGAGARLKMLRKPDGLRAAILIRHWGLTLRGSPSAPRLRSALAVKALDRAFGHQIGAEFGNKSALPAKAGRLLASQLSTSGREFGSDGRLVAALAAEAVGARRSDIKSLQTAVLRRFLGREAASESARAARKRARGEPRGRLGSARPISPSVTPATSGPMAEAAAGAAVVTPPVEVPPKAAAAGAVVRPDPHSFARAVQQVADETAEGWPGNRRAFISRVWALIQARHAEWALSEIEFKCMLTEAHRTGLVALANADLKDKQTLKELQASAVVYKNSVWHYIRAAE